MKLRRWSSAAAIARPMPSKDDSQVAHPTRDGHRATRSWMSFAAAAILAAVAFALPAGVAAADTTPPTTPGTPSVNVSGAFNAVVVSWAASTDDVGVTSYTVSRGGVAIAVLNGTVTTFTDRTASPSTLQSYTITAADAAGNVSASSAAGTGTTASCTTCTTATVRPINDVATTNFAPNIGTVHFNRLSEATADADTTYVYDSSTSAGGSDTVGLASAPAGAIYSVAAHQTARQFVSSGQSGTMNTHLELLNGASVIGTGASHNLPTTYTAYNDTFATVLSGGSSLRLRFAQDSVSTTKRSSRLTYLDAVVTYNPDSTAPTVPTGLAATPGQTTATLSWTASTDAVGVAGYKVFRNASQVGTLLVGSASFTDTTLTPGTTYAYTVAACDAAGNCSAVSSAVNVTPEVTPPTATIAINAGAAATKTTAVTLNVTSSDAGSGVARTEASNDGTTFVTVSGTSPAWTLATGDSTKTVTYRVTDVAGNVTTVSDTIVLDTVPPLATIAINGGAASTGSTAVTLNVTSSDAATGVSSTQASLDGTFWATVSGTSPAFSLVPTTLSAPGVSGQPPGGGALSNLLSPPFQVNAGTSVTVTLTTALSDGGNLGLGCTNNNFSGAATLGAHTWTPTGTGVVTCQAYSWNNNAYRSGLTGAGTIAFTPLDGSKSVSYRVTDGAGNATTVSDTIVLVTSAPSAPGAPDLDTASDSGPVSTLDQTTRVRPVADVVATGPWAYSWGTSGWNLVDEVNVDNSDYVQIGPNNASGTFIFGFGSANLASTDAVRSITFSPNPNGFGIGFWAVRNPATGTLYQLTNYPGETPASLNSRPWDGAAWTPADVANLQYGLVVTNTGGFVPTIYQLYIDVSYKTFTTGAVQGTTVTGPITTGTYNADATTYQVGATITSNPTNTPSVSWKFSFAGNTGSVSTGLLCNNGSNQYDYPASSGLIHTKSWPAGATSCWVYVWSQAGGTYQVTGDTFWYYDPNAWTSPVSTDNVTNDTTPSVSGTNGSTATSVELYDGSTLVGTDTDVSSGSYTIVSSALADGVHTFTVKAVNAVGSSPASAPLAVTIDTVAPAAPAAPDLDSRADTGTSNTDNITDVRSPLFPNVTEPVITGHMVNERDALSPIFTLSSVTTPTMTWTFTYTGYGGRVSTGLMCNNGDYVAQDHISSGLTFSIAYPANASWCYIYSWVGGFGAGPYDVTSGTYTYHDPTIPNSFAFHGTGPAEAAAIGLYDGGIIVGTDNAPAAGVSYVASPLSDLTVGQHTLTTKAFDLAGNVSAASPSLSLSIVSYLGALRTSAPATTVVGATTYVTVATVDETGQPITSLVGKTLTISSDDGGAVYPAGTAYQMKAGDGEIGRTFKVLFSTPGSHTVTVSAPGAVPSTSQFTVQPAALRAAAPATVYQNIPFKLAVMPRVSSKTSGAINKAYGARVTFSSSNAGATFGSEVDASKQYTFICNCDGAHEFATKLTALGNQTITVTDQFGTTDTITVNVVAAPSGGTNPISRIDVLQWPQGNFIDYYVTATGPYELMSVTDGCGLSNQAASETGPAVASGASLARLASDASSSFNTGTLPAQTNTKTYDQGEIRFKVDAGLCGAGGFGENTGYAFTYTDGAGHVFTRSTSGGPEGVWRVFTDIPGSANFVRQGPDSPVISWSIISRGGTGASTFIDPNTGGQVLYSPNAITAQFSLRSSITFYREQVVEDGLGTYDLGANVSGRRLPAGTTQVKFPDVPYHWLAGCADVRMNTGGHFFFAGADGRSGALSGGMGFLGWTTEPGPPSWPCDTPYEGQPNPPDSNDPLRDALDRLGFDDALGLADAANSITHMSIGDPVDSFSGGQSGDITDISLGGRTPFLLFERRYRGELAELAAKGKVPSGLVYTTLGRGWASTLDWRLVISTSTITVRGDDGGAYDYQLRTDGSWAGPDTLRMTLVQSGGGYLLTRPSGDGFRFDSTGRLVAIRDHQAHELTVAYDVNGFVDSFTDAASRTADVTVDGAGRITRIDLPDGRYVTYGYTTDGFLASVRMLDGKTVTYVTDRRGRITAIKDPDGHTILANVYDGRGRVVTQTDALGNASHFAYDRGLNVATLAFGPRGDVSITCFNPEGTTRATLDALDGHRDYTYDRRALATSATDELGAQTRYASDTAGNPTKVTDASGLSVSTVYDGQNRPTSMTGADGSTLTTSYDPTTGGPSTVTRTKGVDSRQVAAYTYNALGLPETITEPGGATTTLLYDSRGYLSSSTDAEGRKTTFVTDARGFVTSSVDPLGNATGGTPSQHTTTMTYDDLGRVLTVTDPLGHVTVNTYDVMGRLATTESPLHSLTTNTYDTKGQLRTVTRSLTASTNATTTYEYDAAGNRTAVVDAENRRTELTYDMLNRLVLTHDADGKDWAVAYDPAGRATKSTDPTGRSTTTAYDAIGRVTTTTDAAGKSTTYGYDTAGRLQTVTDPLTHATTYGYDWMGRQNAVTNAKQETASVVFNAAGDVESVTNARSKTTTFEYDDTHRLTKVTEPGGIVTTFAYDDTGRLASRTNDRTVVEHYEYDADGRPTRVIDPLNHTWTTAYDADGHIDSTLDANGQTVDYTFDLGGRLLSLDPDVGATISFAYDDTDRRESMTDGAGTTTYGYDPIGRLTSSVRGGRTTGYAYDGAGRPQSVTYPVSGGSVGYAYDTAGRLQTITDWASRTTTYGYDDASRVTSITRPGSLATTIGYDELNRPLSVATTKSGNPLLTQTYTYDPDGNLATYGDDAGTATFGYDDLDRLTSAAFPGGQSYTYGYDSVGNLTSAVTPTGSRTLTYDLADRITSAGYTYNNDGALTADPTRTYTYDGFGGLTGIGGATTASYTLDGDGNRVNQTVAGIPTSFDLDLRSATPTVLGDGIRRYLPGDPSAGYEQAGVWYTALADQTGSPQSYVSQSGVQSSITRWDPFGAVRPGSTFAAGIGYAGEWADATGLVNLRARAYDPGVGRFTSRDGFAGLLPLPQTANRYSYALNGPYRYSDPTGHFVNAIYANGPMLASLLIQSSPGIGDAYSVLISAIGFDPVAGISLSPEERAVAFASAAVIGGGYHLLSHLADDVADVGRLEQMGKDFGDATVVRRADEVEISRGVADTSVDVRRLNRFSVEEALGADRLTLKTGPKPYGTGPHNLKIREVADSVTDGQVIAGGQRGLPERLIRTVGGMKSGRRPDILVRRPDGSAYGINVGLQSPRTGAPIRREAEAINDLEQFGGLEMFFVPYN